MSAAVGGRWRTLWDWLRAGKRPEPEPSRLGLIAEPDRRDPAMGICCSGGGIRSAAFNLGALQALRAYDGKNGFRAAKYLAAVSGGSYIAASMWMVGKVGPQSDGDRRADDSDPTLLDALHPPFHRCSPEEQYLRNRSSYLAPDGTGKLFLFFRVLIGLVFNLCFLGLLMFAAGIALAELLYREWFGDLTGARHCAAGAACFTAHIPIGAWIALAVVALPLIGLGLWILLWRTTRQAWETWVVRLLLLEALLGVLLLGVPVLLEVLRDYAARQGAGSVAETAASPPLSSVGAGSVASLLLAVLLQLRAKAEEPASVLQSARGLQAFLRKLGPRLRLAFAYLAGALAGPIVLLGVLLAGASLALRHSSADSTEWTPIEWFAGAVLLFGFLYLVTDLTSWSLHPFYKRRLCTAFALKRVRGQDGSPEARERDYDTLVPLSETGTGLAGDDPWPTLIVCAAANTSDPGATPPGRAVTSFTFTPEEVGGPLVGRVGTARYERFVGKNRRRDITLPAVVAMSGAAVSPSMGKLTRRPLTFLMALANVRLGVWIPNPRRLDGWTRRNALRTTRSGEDAIDSRDLSKRPRPSYLFRELLGRNRIDAKFLYVSDGGHYENLGLVELLRRGCLRVYCFDASGGTSFGALGDAVALARSELGVEVVIDPRDLVPEGPSQLARRDCVTGSIHYPDGAVGTLIYARTVMTEAAPFDVHAYHDRDTTFPHHSTADQLYTDQKFEAYRALGEGAGVRAITAMETAIGWATSRQSNGAAAGSRPASTI